MIDLRISPRSELKNLDVDDHYIEEDGMEYVVTQKTDNSVSAQAI